jgi:hypothetical protein
MTGSRARTAPIVAVAEEIAPGRAFVWVVDWPGWCRGAKTGELARAVTLAYAPRYAAVAREAGLHLPAVDDATVDVIESVPGGSGTEFGVPSAILDDDRRPTTEAEARRLASLVEACWTVLERVAAGAPAELRKGPRGGGRDRDKMLRHVAEADAAYAREIGLGLRPPAWDDRAGLAAFRADMLEILRTPSAGAPLAGRRWTARYAARRIAWHAVDHAWEMEDRSVAETADKA